MNFIILNQEGLFDGPYTEENMSQALAINGGMALEIPLDKISYDDKGELSPNLSLDEWKKTAEKAINKAAHSYRQNFVPDVLTEEYKIKEAAAQAYLKNIATDEQIAILTANHTDAEKEADAIIAKASEFNQIWPLIIAKRMQSNKAVRAAESIEAILDILKQSQKEACQIFEEQIEILEENATYRTHEDSTFLEDNAQEENTPIITTENYEPKETISQTNILDQILPLIIAQQMQEGGTSKTTESLEQILTLLKQSQG